MNHRQLAFVSAHKAVVFGFNGFAGFVNKQSFARADIGAVFHGRVGLAQLVSILGHIRALNAHGVFLVGELGNVDLAVNFGNKSHTFGFAGFKQFFYAGQTLSNIFHARGSASVESSHGQLRTRLTNGLSGHNAHSCAEFHHAVKAQVIAVAQAANSASQFAF